MATDTRNSPDSSTLHLPRLLFLHGGGTNATVFRLQCRALLARLDKHFRPVFAEAPFLCDAHPAVVAVYSECGPFRRWLPWLPTHRHASAASIVADVTAAVRAAMLADDGAGATGDWVGLVGFSQGAKLAASMLLEQQARDAQVYPSAERAGGGWPVPGVRWRFGVLMAGRAPPVRLDRELQEGDVGLAEADESIVGFEESWGAMAATVKCEVPTVHVHGLQDPGLELHRALLSEYFVEGSARLVEWDGNHRIVFKAADVLPVVSAIMEVANIEIDP